MPAYLRSGYFVKIAILTFLCGSASSMVSTYLSVFLAQRSEASAAQIGTFVSLSSLSGLIVGTVIARYTDKHDERKIPLAFALVCAIIGYGLYAFLTNYWLLLAVSLTLIGVSTTITSQLFAYAKQIFDAHNAPESAVTIMRTFVSVAWVTGPLAAAWLYDTWGFGGLLAGTVAGFLTCLPVLFLFFGSHSAAASRAPSEPAATVPHIHAPSRTANGVIAAYFIVFIMLNAINTVINTNLPLYVTQTLGHSNSYVGIIMSISAFLEIPMMIGLAALSTKIQANRLIAAGIVSIILFLALIPFTQSIHVIIALQILKALFCSAFLGLGISFFQAMIPTQYGLSTVLFTNTTRIGTILAGAITALSGNHYSNAFIVLLAASVIALALFLITYNGELRRIPQGENG